MFWTDIDTKEPGKIERARMDGTGREVLADNVGWANGITVDYARRVIIWIGTRLSFIKYLIPIVA